MIETIDERLEDVVALLDRPFYSPSDVADIAGVSTTTVLNWIKADRLACVRLSERTLRIPRRSLLRLLAPESTFAPRRVDLDEIPIDAD